MEDLFKGRHFEREIIVGNGIHELDGANPRVLQLFAKAARCTFGNLVFIWRCHRRCRSCSVFWAMHQRW